MTVKILAIDEASGKISLSLKALTEAGQGMKDHKDDRNRLEILLNSSGQGFNSLKEKLVEWIEQSKNDQLMQK